MQERTLAAPGMTARCVKLTKNAGIKASATKGRSAHFQKEAAASAEEWLDLI
jgi:hypothetical protein